MANAVESIDLDVAAHDADSDLKGIALSEANVDAPSPLPTPVRPELSLLDKRAAEGENSARSLKMERYAIEEHELDSAGQRDDEWCAIVEYPALLSLPS